MFLHFSGGLVMVREVEADGSKSVGVMCCDLAFHTAAEAEQHERTCPKYRAPVVAAAKREILEDIARGVVPATVRGFDELHDYVDANGYGGAFEDDHLAGEEGFNRWVGFWNAVQEEVHQWLQAGRPA